MEAIIEITDKFGRRRRARRGEVPADGEAIHFNATLMDAMAQVMMSNATEPDHTIRDAHGTPSGHAPGYAFCADDARLRSAANEAYEQRCERLRDAWRHPDQKQDYEDEPLTAPTPDHARALAQEAWQDKKVRLANAWRNR